MRRWLGFHLPVFFGGVLFFLVFFCTFCIMASENGNWKANFYHLICMLTWGGFWLMQKRVNVQTERWKHILPNMLWRGEHWTHILALAPAILCLVCCSSCLMPLCCSTSRAKLWVGIFGLARIWAKVSVRITLLNLIQNRPFPAPALCLL